MENEETMQKNVKLIAFLKIFDLFCSVNFEVQSNNVTFA